jgi:hypothetical protein
MYCPALAALELDLTPHQFLAEVVQPNVEAALKDPDNLQHACNALQSMDALMGITFWHLHSAGDQRATQHNDDSAFKNSLAAQSDDVRALRDASFSLKHGRLTRGNRVMDSASKVTSGINVLGFFRLGDRLGGQLVFLELANGKTPARDVIAGAHRFLKPYVDGIPP